MSEFYRIKQYKSEDSPETQLGGIFSTIYDEKPLHVNKNDMNRLHSIMWGDSIPWKFELAPYALKKSDSLISGSGKIDRDPSADVELAKDVCRGMRLLIKEKLSNVIKKLKAAKFVVFVTGGAFSMIIGTLVVNLFL